MTDCFLWLITFTGCRTARHSIPKTKTNKEPNTHTCIAQGQVDDGSLRLLEPRDVDQEGEEGEAGRDDAETRPGPDPVPGEGDLLRRKENLL